MTDSTDNARGPERAVLQALKPDGWPETVHVGKAVIRFPNGVESGNWYSKPDDGDKTMPFARADLAPTPQDDACVKALVEALRDIADGMGEMTHSEIGRFAPAVARIALAAFDKGGKTDG